MTECKRYRKRPIEIEAFRWGGGSIEFDHHPQWFRESTNVRVVDTTPPELGVMTAHGEVVAKVGDWVIKSPSGEIYPCAAGTFEMIYEEAPPRDPLDVGFAAVPAFEAAQ